MVPEFAVFALLEGVNLPMILLAAFVAAASPGPATLAIAGTSMGSGRRFGLALACGVTTGSCIWSASAAFGLGAVMLANAWAFELLRYAGAAYLAWLAYKSAKAALSRSQPEAPRMATRSIRAAYFKGLAIHLTNPKAILFFGSLFSIGIPANAKPGTFAMVSIIVVVQGAILFQTYAILFSFPAVVAAYARLRRWFEATFSLAFGVASIKVLTARLQ